jgi:hypothetical protein
VGDLVEFGKSNIPLLSVYDTYISRATLIYCNGARCMFSNLDREGIDVN